VTTFDLSMRLIAALCAGALIGVEREVREKAAGIRTHALVSVGAALFTLAGAYGFPELDRGETVDPMRVAAQVASGIGFIGAGAILRDGMAVRGVTTAATLWLSAALGLTAGAGAWGPLLVGCGVVAVALVGLRALKKVFSRRRRESAVVQVTLTDGEAGLRALFDALDDHDLPYDGLELDGPAGGDRRVTIQVRTPRRQLELLIAGLASVGTVQHLSAEVSGDVG
jgi:putative Mg2+ transporter-C (MgtC) family protein